MIKTIFDQEKWIYFTNHQWTPLHEASFNGYLEVVKYLIEKGTDVNSFWNYNSLEFIMNVFTLINNFNDPFYRRLGDQDEGYFEIEKSQMSILIENGMI